MCCRRRLDGPPAESGLKESSPPCTNEQDGTVAREIEATGKRFILASSSLRGAGWRSCISWTTAVEQVAKVSVVVVGGVWREGGRVLICVSKGPLFLPQETSGTFERLFSCLNMHN